MADERTLNEISLEIIQKFKKYPEFSGIDMLILRDYLLKIHEMYAGVEFKKLVSQDEE